MNFKQITEQLQKFLIQEMALEAELTMDLSTFIQKSKQDDPNVKRKKYMVKGYKDLGVPSDTFRHVTNYNNKVHNLSIKHWNDVFENLKNIVVAKQGKPNSFGRNVFVFCCKGKLAYYYITLNVNKNGNLLTTIAFQNMKELNKYFPNGMDKNLIQQIKDYL